jgi:hypothetical protein
MPPERSHFSYRAWFQDAVTGVLVTSGIAAASGSWLLRAPAGVVLLALRRATCRRAAQLRSIRQPDMVDRKRAHQFVEIGAGDAPKGLPCHGRESRGSRPTSTWCSVRRNCSGAAPSTSVVQDEGVLRTLAGVGWSSKSDQFASEGGENITQMLASG